MHPNDLYAYLFYTSTISFPFFLYKYIYIYFCNHNTGFYHYYFKFSPILQDANLNLCCRYTVFFLFFFFKRMHPKRPNSLYNHHAPCTSGTFLQIVVRRNSFLFCEVSAFLLNPCRSTENHSGLNHNPLNKYKTISSSFPSIKKH